MNVRRLLLPLTFAAMAAFCAQATAQGAFPAPLPNQAGGAASPFPPVNASGSAPAASPFPPVSNAAPAQQPPAAATPSAQSAAASQGVFTQGAAPVGAGLAPPGAQPRGTAEQEECMAKFAPLREEAQKRAGMIKAASDRKAPPQEACGLIKAYVAAEQKLVNYVTTKQTACGIPAEIPKQLKANQSKSQQMLKAVCQAAAQPQGGPAAAPSLSEVLGQSNAPTEVRSAKTGGGSTFDTINGNVLSR